MKRLPILAFFLCCVFTPRAFPQNPTPWNEVVQESDYFRVTMPHQPGEETISGLNTNFGYLSITGRSYETSTDGAIYKLWVLNSGDADRQRKDPDVYLDASAELVWEGLLKPVREKLPEERQKHASMSYGGEISNKPTRGREYTINLGEVTGTVEFYIAESRLYVLLAAYPAGGASEAKRFFDSFKLDAGLPGLLAPPAAPKSGVGVAEVVNPTGEQQILRSRDVTERARVLEKPEPSYTESARKFSVTGTVVLRVVFTKDGEVTNINIIRRLPHGLTEKAINAARMIKFRPAIKDGQPVSTWMQLEYNFNLF